MKADEPRTFSKDLLQARNPFQNWRSQRPVGSPIPESNWNLAVRLARLHGLSLTARVHASIITALKNGWGETIPNSHPGNLLLSG
jgi:hypothetical protein